MNVEIDAQYGSEIAEMTALPEELQEYFAAKSQHCFLDYAGPMKSTQNSARGCHVVQFDELPESLQKLCRTVFDRPESSHGLLRRGDTILFAQPLAARDHWRGIALQRQLAMEDASDRKAEEIQEIFQENFRSRTGQHAPGFVRVKKESKANVREQAIGGGRLLAEVQRAGR